MNKFIKIIFVFIGIIFICGCQKTTIGQNVTKCTLDNDQSKSGYKVKTTYKIYSKNDIVTKVDTNEILTSENTTIIKYFDDLYKKQYKSENDKYGGYTYDVKTDKNKVILNVTINYNKIDLDSYIKDNSAMKSYVNKDNKMTLKGIKTMYESLGAKCK